MKQETGESPSGGTVEMPQSDSLELGRVQVRAIVETTLGKGVKPPPVVFPAVYYPGVCLVSGLGAGLSIAF